MKVLNRVTYLIMISLLVGAMWLNTASALSLDLNSPELQHGTVLTDQFASQGVHVSAINRDNEKVQSPVIFDSRKRYTADRDLEGPRKTPSGIWGSWNGGNIPKKEVLGNLLIIPEEPGLPNDEGSRPAGSISFDFDYTITSFGFDLIDVEGPEEYGDDSGFFAAFYDGDDLVKSMGFGELIARDNAVFGNNSANRIAPISAEELGLSGFDRVEINMGGSGGVTGIEFTRAHPPIPPTIPEPTTVLLLGIGLAALAGLKRKFRK